MGQGRRRQRLLQGGREGRQGHQEGQVAQEEAQWPNGQEAGGQEGLPQEEDRGQEGGLAQEVARQEAGGQEGRQAQEEGRSQEVRKFPPSKSNHFPTPPLPSHGDLKEYKDLYLSHVKYATSKSKKVCLKYIVC